MRHGLIKYRMILLHILLYCICQLSKHFSREWIWFLLLVTALRVCSFHFTPLFASLFLRPTSLPSFLPSYHSFPLSSFLPFFLSLFFFGSVHRHCFICQYLLARYLFIYFCLLYQFLEYQEEDEDTACWLLQRQVRTSLIRCYVKNETDAQILEAKEAKEALLKNSKVKTLEGTVDSHTAW